MKYIIKKFSALIITLFVISFLSFFAFQVIPGDSALVSLGTNATKEELESRREELGYNKSIPERYLNWLTKALKGDFGDSTSYNMPVNQLLAGKFSVTIGLGMMSILFIVIISVPIGILSSKRNQDSSKIGISLLMQIGMAIPPFFLGMIITLLFGLILKWFTPGNYIPPSEHFFGYIRFMIFPALAIAIPKIAMMVKFLRSSIDRQLALDYVRTAKSKGNTKTQVLYHHVLKNACIPVITFLGMMIAEVMAGSIVIEQVFNMPGLGRLLVVAISNRDFMVVQVIILYIAALVMIVNFLVDIAYQWVDPRLRR